MIELNKREELLTNAAKILYEEGVQKLTIDYLAQESNITKGGVLYHFKNKANLLLEMNRMAIERFEGLWKKHRQTLSGSSVITRSYALATLDFFKNRDKALLPAVFISSLEDEASFVLWKQTSRQWEKLFENDSGNKEKNLSLRLICDGVWFSILYAADSSLDKKIEKTVLNYCQSLEKEL